ncbi:MAG: hypothetical protein E7443_01335 [Ruminococcaceae bacterium]|nr:hypothetical protein [Oscillospiraceae bacterium]
MTELWALYHKEIPPFLREFASTPPMLRLKRVGMNCGCEYTRFPLFRGLAPYSRYDHSLGVALIVWHFTGIVEQSLAGLFHDVTTPVFAHVVDFLNGDHLRQESTEAGVAECLTASAEVCALLEKYGLTVEDVSDYHRYPVADNDAPALSADRLEYTMGNLLNYGFVDAAQLRGFYQDLTVGQDEYGKAELAFRTPETASSFARMALRTAKVYVADEDRFAMEVLAGLLRQALERGVLTRGDLMTTETKVIEKLRGDTACAAAWERFCGFSRMVRSAERPQEGQWLRVDAKRRWIDPLAQGKGRVSRWDNVFCEELRAFREMDFSCWLSAE